MRWLLFILVIVPGMPEAAQCTASSGPGTTALVELYTAEDCSGCAPADRWLATLGSRYPVGSVLPLALHVDYRSYIGPKDHAKRGVLLRQRKLSPRQQMALVYTPRVLLQGREFREWGDKAFDEALAGINAQPARAQLHLAILGTEGNTLEVEVRAELLDPSAAAPGLYLASSHRHVVLEWQGPFAFAGKAVAERRKVPLLPGAAPANSGVAAFVQDRRTGDVLQALLRSAC